MTGTVRAGGVVVGARDPQFNRLGGTSCSERIRPKIAQGMEYIGYNHTLYLTDTRGICI
jgi:hypothetical protein